MRPIREAAPATLVQVREFDRYQGKGVPDGKVSLSLRLTFQASDRTLTDAEVQSAMDAILAALKSGTARSALAVRGLTARVTISSPIASFRQRGSERMAKQAVARTD